MGAAPCSHHHLWLLVPRGWFLVGSYPCSTDAHVVTIFCAIGFGLHALYKPASSPGVGVIQIHKWDLSEPSALLV